MRRKKTDLYCRGVRERFRVSGLFDGERDFDLFRGNGLFDCERDFDFRCGDGLRLTLD